MGNVRRKPAPAFLTVISREPDQFDVPSLA